LTRKKFVQKWTAELTGEGIKSFPSDFTQVNEFEEIEVPGKTLVIGEEFFGHFEVLTVDGAQIYQAQSHPEAKFIIYSNRSKPGSLKLPRDKNEIKRAITAYENYLDGIIKRVDSDYKKSFPGEKENSAAINEIFKMLNLTRY
jgi:hypothetical protein